MSALHLLSPLNFLAVGLGAAFGAWARWLLGLALNPLFIALPLGTLAANLLGGYAGARTAVRLGSGFVRWVFIVIVSAFIVRIGGQLLGLW